MFSKKLFVLLAFAFFTEVAIAKTTSNSYIARISTKDHYNKRGNKLTKVADILQQDRANFWKYNIRDSEDTPDNYFFTKENRFKIRRMLQNGYISGDAAYQIINGTPVIKVEIHKKYDYINVYLYQKDKSLKAKRKVNLSKTEKIAILKLLSKSNNRYLKPYKKMFLFPIEHGFYYRDEDGEVKYSLHCSEISKNYYHCKFIEGDRSFDKNGNTEDEGATTISFDVSNNNGQFKIENAYPVDMVD